MIGECLVWLIGMVVCGPICSLTRAIDGRIVRCGQFMPISCHLPGDCKALLVAKTHVRSAVANSGHFSSLDTATVVIATSRWTDDVMAAQEICTLWTLRPVTSWTTHSCTSVCCRMTCCVTSSRAKIRGSYRSGSQVLETPTPPRRRPNIIFTLGCMLTNHCIQCLNREGTRDVVSFSHFFSNGAPSVLGELQLWGTLIVWTLLSPFPVIIFV